MTKTTRFAIGLSAFGLLITGSLLASDWPGFRGSHGGIADDKDLPTQMTNDNILWKIKLPGAGTSSPITTGDKIFLTCNAGYGTSISKGMTGGFGGKGGLPGKGGGGKGGFPGKGGFAKGDADQQKLKLLVLCIDRAKGDIAWSKEVQPKLPEASFTGMMREHSYASSTPVTDGKAVYVFFGKSGVHAFGLEGTKLWSADVGSSTHMWGSAASPVLHDNLLIVNAAIESKSLIALDKKTGKEVWRKSGLGTSWASPIVVKTKEGKYEIILNAPGKIAAYEPETGKELWTCQGVVSAGGAGGGAGGFGGGFGPYTASTPVAKDGVVYVIGGGGPTPAATIAVKTGGKGDVTKTHVLWRAKAGATNCSPVLVGDHLCWVDASITCLKTSDGSVAYKERLYTGNNEYVSAITAGDKIYALTRLNGLFILNAGAEFDSTYARFAFKGDDSVFNASPAISDGRMYLRSNEYLYCVGKK